MKFCYIDESGTGDEPIAVMVGLTAPKFDGKRDVIRGYANNILNLAIPKSNIYLARRRCPAADYFYRYAPTPIR